MPKDAKQKLHLHKCAIENTMLSQGSSAAAVNRTSKRMTKSECSTNVDGQRLSKRAKLTVDNAIFTDLCCVYFGSYEEDEGTGRECSCDRWIHQDCILANNSNKLCHFC